MKIMTACGVVLAVLCMGGMLAAAYGGEKPTAASIPKAKILGGKKRLLAFLSTDKPIYKPGETMFSRGVILSGETFFPARADGMTAVLTITGPRGEDAASMTAEVRDATAGFAWAIPAGLAGGRYEARVVVDGCPPAARSFEVRAYAPPRLKSQIEFLREGYGPGDEVVAVARFSRAEGGIPAGAGVTAVARVDNREAARVEGGTVNADGTCRIAFVLPREIERGEGTLAFMIEDGGVVETATKTIPILLRTLELAFYPEGGELVAGLPGRFYLEARRPDGKPADVTGELVVLDENGGARPGEGPVANVVTVHEGRGIAAFTPRSGERYALRVTRPSGVDALFPLPAIRESGVVLHADKEAYAYDDPITLTIYATPGSGASRVTLHHREKRAASAAVAESGKSVALQPIDVEGVLIATVWDKSGKPLAERLVFRHPRFAVRLGLKVETVPAGGSPVPGGMVRVTVEARDENDRPVEAVVGLAVTDDALLEMVETRDQAPSLPAMVYLENEVRDLADAAAYFAPADPERSRNIDLLLGTQGWRRFVLVRLDEAIKENPDAVRRALAIRSLRPKVAPMTAPRAVLEMKMADAREEIMHVADQFFGAEREEEAAQVEAAPPVAMAIIIEQPVAPEAWIPENRREDNAVLGRYRAAPMKSPPPATPVLVREYAHQVRSGRRPNDRVDFTETLYWHAGLRTNPRDGTAEIVFGLSDSVTSFRVRADAFGNNGALGDASLLFSSLEPFHVESKLPSSVVAGDRLDVPVILVNATAQALERPTLTVDGGGLAVTLPDMPERLAPDSRDRVILRVDAASVGEHSLILNAAAVGHVDRVTRPLVVLPLGFPVLAAASGLVGPEKPFEKTFAIADDVVSGSMRATVKVYPSPLANMEEALNSLLRHPHGCFEQTSSTSYPLVMAQQYFMTHDGVAPEKISRAGTLLQESYRKLVGFECPENGYEWFGGDPGHEALTAYGLMQFTEMATVMPVDGGMMARTRKWLLSRRDGEGGFQRNDRALDSFGAAPEPVTNMYILWTLLESGEEPDSLAMEIERARKLTAETGDSYLLALGANILHLAGERAAARTAALALQNAQDKDGVVAGAETTITRSGGESLRIETTSLAVIAWLRAGDEFSGTVEKAMSWLFESCKAGRFGSTQSTILALKAINAYDAARAVPKAPGQVQLLVDGRPFGHPARFDEHSRGAIELPDFSAAMTPGEHVVGLVMTGGGDMPFAVEMDYHTPRPANGAACPLSLSTSLSESRIAEGEPVDLSVRVTAGKDDVVMPLTVIGLPAGLEPRHERLKEMTAAGMIASYEMFDRELVLYWRALKAGEVRDVLIPLVAHMPGRFTAPASRVYAYYLDEEKYWTPGETVEITAR